MRAVTDHDLDALTPGEVKQFFDEGYLLVPGVLSREVAASYAGAVLDLLPRDLTIPEDWNAHAGRFKPYRRLADGTRDDCFDTPELLPLFCNRRLYLVAAQLLGSPHLRVYDGSVGITMRNLTERDVPRSQRLHIDASVPNEVDEFMFTPEELQVGGCYYLTDVLTDGGGIHVVPGGHRYVEEVARGTVGGRHLHDDWKRLPDMSSIEVTGGAGDFAILHHLMPHAASHNRLPAARLAVFLRYVRVDQAHGYGNVAPRTYSAAQLSAIDPLGRRLLGLDPWQD
jgi:ectoine hydroxylase-related dioxygenase (phytanoyl-CoA dioxygenase family)